MKRIIPILMSLVITLSCGAAEGFHTDGTSLLDDNGNEFLMRGCNYSFAWQKKQYAKVIPAAKRIGCNTVRIQLGTGSKFSKCTVQEVENLIKLCEENKLVAVFNTHDETGSDNVDDLVNAANYWISLKDLLNAHKNTVIVNISNEWCGSWSSKTWAEGYKKVIPMLREAGLENTLVVDCAGWGQCAKSIWEKGPEVAAADPLANIVFSIHMYQNAGGTADNVRTNIDKALATGFPVIVGEFAYQHGGASIAWQTILDYSAEKNVGYLVWSWTGNSSDVADCDMFATYDESSYKQNGKYTVLGRNGIKETSRECSVFGSENPGLDDPVNPDNPDNPEDPENPQYGQEQILAKPDFAVTTWNDMYHLEPSVLGPVAASDILRLHVSADAGAQVQVAYATEASGWNQYIDYAPIAAPTYDIPFTNTALLAGANFNGLYLKGTGYTIHEVGILKPQTSAVEELDLDWGETMTDFPVCRIFATDGREVKDIHTPGIYIFVKGSKTEKRFVRP